MLFDVRIHHPAFRRLREEKDFDDGIETTFARTKPIGDSFKTRFPEKYKRVFNHRL
jgi:hypothetical protein